MKKLNSKKIINYDSKSDVLYLGVKKGIEEEFIEISSGINVELNKNGQVIGVEILNASKVLKSIIKLLQIKRGQTPLHLIMFNFRNKIYESIYLTYSRHSWFDFGTYFRLLCSPICCEKTI